MPARNTVARAASTRPADAAREPHDLVLEARPALIDPRRVGQRGKKAEARGGGDGVRRLGERGRRERDEARGAEELFRQRAEPARADAVAVSIEDVRRERWSNFSARAAMATWRLVSPVGVRAPTAAIRGARELQATSPSSVFVRAARRAARAALDRSAATAGSFSAAARKRASSRIHAGIVMPAAASAAPGSSADSNATATATYSSTVRASSAGEASAFDARA